MAVAPLLDLSADTLRPVDWSKVQVMVAFSRTWDSPLSPLHWGPVRRFWSRYFGYVPPASREDLRHQLPITLEHHLERRGQWLDIYVNAGVPRGAPGPALKAMN
jgi:hypothetical protein